MKIAVLGASGFIGRRLVPLLTAEGHHVVAIGRNAATLPIGDGVEAVAVDVADETRLADALAGAEAVYYLVHSMAGGDRFVRRDRALAESFARAARRAGVRRVVYLGALGHGDLSAHLASRQEVGAVLHDAAPGFVELRAAVILGAGSISFEMLRSLVERLPAMVCPRWVRTQISPVAVADMLRYLVGALAVTPGIYEVGIARATSYREMMDVFARARGLRPRLILDVPLLTLTLSSYWVDLVTPVDKRVSHALIESLAHEVIVRDDGRTRDAFGFDPMPLDDAMLAALDEQLHAISDGLLDLSAGSTDGVHVVRIEHPIPAADEAGARADLAEIGGDLHWYGLAWAWWLRLTLGRLVGERWSLGRPKMLEPGTAVDWWEIQAAGPGLIALRARWWGSGDAWLGYRVRDGRFRQVAAFRPRGIPGLLYWGLLRPVHGMVFRGMARHRLTRARRRRA